MSARYTKRDAVAAFERITRACARRVATSWNDVGAWELDYNPTYGGYVVYEIGNAAGGVSTPLGDQRRTAREFCDAVYFAERVLSARRAAVVGIE